MKIYIQKLILCLALLAPFATANSAVNLSFSEAPAISVTAGGQFTLTLNLAVTAGEPVVAVDYYLQELSAAGFTILSRDITGSVFTQPYFTNTEVASSSDQATGGGPNGQPDNALNPRNDLDLGGNTSSSANVTTGSGLVATFTIGVPLNASGQYTISTTSNAGTGWVNRSTDPTPHDHAFDQQASILITVVPEPATWSLIGLGALGVFGVNLWRSKARRA
jgi:PEP-CTERM motif-containing protein